MADHPLLSKARALPERPGVYVMRDAVGTEIYAGKAKNLRRRVSSYFQARDRPAKERALVEQIDSFEHIETDTELEAFLLESRFIKDLQPKYNVLLKNNEGYPYLEVTWGEDFPRVRVSWRQENPKSRYYGPYVGIGGLKSVVATLQRLFLFRLCGRALDAGDARLRHGRGCLNLHLKRCAGPCCGRIGKDEYRRRVAGLCRFLDGGKKELLADLRREMAEAAAGLRFEEAARLRDQLQTLEAMHERPELDPSLRPTHFHEDPAKGVAALRDALGLPAAPRRIEGIDIANLMGRETVGSLVRFLDGVPFKGGYRRFRIQSVDGQDDFAAIAEVVRRRYGRLAARARERRYALRDAAGEEAASRLQALAGEPEPAPADEEVPACPADPGLAAAAGGADADAAARWATTGGFLADDCGEGADDTGDDGADAPPDVVLIDGGKGQLAAAARSMAEAGFRPLALLSLAKAEEIVYRWTADGPEELRWSRRHPALKMLMRVRDESHRFAQHYHHLLRRKTLFGGDG